MSLESDIAKFATKTNRNVEAVRRGVIIELFTAIIDDSPVDKGLLRGNWQTSIRSPKTNTLKSKSKTGPLPINRIARNLGKGDTDVYLTNNLPYARVAEFGLWKGPTDKVTSQGFSKQAPAGMVRLNVLRFKKLFRKKVRELR